MEHYDAMDEDFLAATEEFLLQYESSTEFLEQDRSTRGTHPTERSRFKATDRRVRYRQKLRNERETLKQQERELTATLHKLRAAQVRAKEEMKKANSMSLSAWRATAKRLKERRLQAEEQQRQLSTAVSSQFELINNLNAFLLQPVAMCEEHIQARDVSGALLFKTFVADLDSLYAKTSDFIAETELTLSPSETYRTRRKWNEDRTLFDSTGAIIIRFDFERTWHAMSSKFLSDPSGCHYCGEIQDPEDTAAITYRLNYVNNVTLVVYNVVRRYVEKDRVVFVWRVLTEGQGEFEGLFSE